MLPIQVNSHLTAIFFKELVRRAMDEIRRQRFLFDATDKVGYDGKMEDVFTTADTAAQAIYEKSIREALPGVGIIGEEGLCIPCTLEGVDAYVVIDPLDGTKAYVRRQSHGVSTMVALVVNGSVVTAWIGDVNTMEIYGYRSESPKVHRLSDLRAAQDLMLIERSDDPTEKYILLRESPTDFPDIVAAAVNDFNKYHIDGGSVGTWFARLWKGEYDGVILNPGHETPWDSTPFIGISKKLGFVFLRPGANAWEQYEPELVREVVEREHFTLVVHQNMMGRFLS